MAEMTIRLRCDPLTGKKDIVVGLQSDEELLPHEHELRHKELVDKLVRGGILHASEVGRIIVERESDEREQAPRVSETPQAERRKESEGA